VGKGAGVAAYSACTTPARVNWALYEGKTPFNHPGYKIEFGKLLSEGAKAKVEAPR
jgi:hypothetical protein